MRKEFALFLLLFSFFDLQVIVRIELSQSLLHGPPPWKFSLAEAHLYFFTPCLIQYTSVIYTNISVCWVCPEDHAVSGIKLGGGGLQHAKSVFQPFNLSPGHKRRLYFSSNALLRKEGPYLEVINPVCRPDCSVFVVLAKLYCLDQPVLRVV